MQSISLFFFLLCTFCLHLQGQTQYYVSVSNGNDNNDGLSLATPWQSIQKSMNEATPNSVVNIRAGIYSEKVEVYVSGTAGNPIVFQNYNNEEVILDATGINFPDAIIGIFDQNYVTIKGLELRNNIQLDAQGILVEGNCTGIELLDNEISNIHFSNDPNEIANSTKNSQPIIIYGTDANNAISELVINGNTIRDSRTGYSEGLAVNGNVDGFVVSNNIVHHVENIGIDVIGHENTASSNDQARNGIINNNQVYSCKSPYATAAGIYVDGGKNLIIEANEISDCQWGIEIGCENFGKSTSNVIVRNNIIYSNDDAGITIGGFDFPNFSGKVIDCTVRNNTLYGNDKTSTGLGGISGELVISYTENCSLQNNIIFGTNISNLMMYVENSNSQNLLLDYNLYYSESNFYYDYKGTYYDGFDNYQNGSSSDQNSINAIPQFIDSNNEDFHLSPNSPAINNGNPSFLVSDDGELDFDGNTRIQEGIVDQGAFESNAELTLNLRLFLEGPFQSNGEMNTVQFPVLPLSHPYQNQPYNIPSLSISNFPNNNIVDWLIVELRSGSINNSNNNTSLIERKIALLDKWGNVLDPFSGASLRFTNTIINNDYFVLVRHRNHLDVMSSTAVESVNGIMNFDFSLAANTAFGAEQLKEINSVSASVWCLHAGDFNQDGVIQTTDYDVWKSDPSIANQYSLTDGNLDGTVQTTDFDTWFRNKAKIGSIAIQF